MTENGVAFTGSSWFSSFEEEGIIYDDVIRYKLGDNLTDSISIRNNDLIPDFMKRNKKGTSVFIPDFNLADEDFESQTINAFLENLMVSIIEKPS